MKRTPSRRGARPSLAVWKMASCDGCQLSLLDCEDELLAVAGAVEIAHFPEATRASRPGPYDVSLVEGSITTPRDAARIQEIRRASKTLVTLGACATAGGIQALRNFADVKAFAAAVYPHPEWVETLAGGWNVGSNLRQVVIFRRDDAWNLVATMVNLQPALFGRQSCPPGEIWLSDSDVVLVPKGKILIADEFIDLVFTRGIYGVFPLISSINFSTLSRL